MTGSDLEGGGQPDSNLVCASYGGLLLPPPQVSRNIKNTFVRACFSSAQAWCSACGGGGVGGGGVDGGGVGGGGVSQQDRV